MNATDTTPMPSDLDIEEALQYRIFDPQLCDEIDLEWLIGAVESQGVTADEVQSIVDAGLIRRWKSPKGKEGFLLYSERQVRVAKTLRDTGLYSEAELQHIFDHWHLMIEICMIDHLAYDSYDVSDYEHFRRRSAENLRAFGDVMRDIQAGEAPWMGEHQKKSTEEHFEYWSKWNRIVMAREDEELSHSARLNWRKALTHQRWIDEFTRVGTADNLARQIEQGYSADIVFNGYSISGDGYELTNLNWRQSLQRFKEVRNEGKVFPLRTPDFTITEAGIVFTTVPTLEALQTFHEKYQLDTLRELLAEWGTSLWESDLAASGRAECAECKAPFERTKASRKFCGDGCRNRAKQRRFRENNPEKAGATQARYYGQNFPEVLA